MYLFENKITQNNVFSFNNNEQQLYLLNSVELVLESIAGCIYVKS